MNARCDVLVIVGTDHHPFNRLITWVNEWLGQHPERLSDFFVQWGAATVRPVCDGAQMIAADQLHSLLGGARVMICHGGGGSIADAWAAGLAPIVVPRVPQLGEHVDDHQLHFSAKLAELGHIRLAQTQTVFGSFLDDATSDAQIEGPRPSRIGSMEAEVDATVTRFAALVDELVSRRRRRFSLIGGTQPGTGPGGKSAGRGRITALHPRPSKDEITSFRRDLSLEGSTNSRASNVSARAATAGLPSEEHQ